MWSRACILEQELLDYHNNASALARYCNQAAGLQEQLPVSIKKRSSTGRWTSLIERAHSINVSYQTLMRNLSEPHRDRALLIAAVNRNLSSEILKFMQPFSKLFEVLQFNSKPTINFAVLTYYKAAEPAKRCPTNNPVIATLKKVFLMVLNKSFFETSLKFITGLERFSILILNVLNFCSSVQTKNWCFKYRQLDLETHGASRC